MMNQVFLTLQNGQVFEGFSKENVPQDIAGEVVFTTGMTGYPESLTDPSYSGQILVFTYPLIGNYGVPPSHLWESNRIHVRAVVVSENAPHCSHHLAKDSLFGWLKEHNIPIISGVDTRALTKILRSSGTMLGVVSSNKNLNDPFKNIHLGHTVDQVSTRETRVYGKGPKRIIAVDCGMKENLIRSLMQFPIEIVRVPHDEDYSETAFDGVFLSNGPGDPQECKQTIAVLQKVLKKKKPVFGVCLGSQMLGLAVDAKTYKLKFGHRGQNQPCMDMKTGRCYVTSQNHGYAVDEHTLPADWEVSFRNLNDNSVEGIAHRSLPFFAVQFHPEASPGPTDTNWLFERFYACL